MIDFLSGYSPHIIYFLLFFLLFLCGIGFPMAEELVLLAGGSLVAYGRLNPLIMLLSIFLGVIVSDVMLFWLGRGLAARLPVSTYLTRWLSPRRLAKGEAFFATHGSHTVFLVRFIPGLRAPTFLLAGTMHMSVWRFVVIDTLAALIFIPVVCWLGYVFADRFEVVGGWFRSAERAMLTLLVLTGLSWLLRRYLDRRANPAAAWRAESTD